MKQNADFITDFIFVKSDIIPCEVILVPGGSHPQLAEKAAELYKKGMGRYILFSGGTNRDGKYILPNPGDAKKPNAAEYPSEAEWLKSVAIGLGVPGENILCESKAAHTFENAGFSLALLKKMNINTDKVILVCKEYHSRRALLTYQYYFPKNTAFFVAPVTDKRGLNRDNWTTKPEYITKVMGEVEKIGKYFKDKIAKGVMK